MEKRNNYTVFLSLLAIIMVMGSHILFAAQVPKTEKEIPVFTGAVRNTDEESVQKEQMGWENNPNLRSAVLKIYNTGSSLEDVVGFYVKAIGGKEGVFDENPFDMQPGAVSQVSYEIEYYTEEDFEDYVIDTIEFSNKVIKHPGTWIKQKLTENRKPYQQGKWIKAANFYWVYKETNNDLTTFNLNILDLSVESAPKEYKTTSQIEIQVTTEKSEEAMREETDEEMDRNAEALSRKLASNPPTAKDLGAPLYPGATFDPESTAGMSAGNDYAIYIYRTNDQPSKVADFYEQQLKIKPSSMGNDRYMIPLKGSMPIPDEGIVIEPNTMFGGSAKSVISIQKMVGKND